MLADVSGWDWRSPRAPMGTVTGTRSRTGSWTHSRTGGGRGTSPASGRLLYDIYNMKHVYDDIEDDN